MKRVLMGLAAIAAIACIPQTASAQDGADLTLVHGIPGTTVDLCLLYTSPSPRDGLLSRMPSSA